MLSESTPNPERDAREEFFDALFEIAAKYDVPLTNNIPSPGVRHIGDFCGDIERAVIAAGYRRPLDPNVRTVNVLREDYDRLKRAEAELAGYRRQEVQRRAVVGNERMAQHVRKVARYEGITEGQEQVLLTAADLIESLTAQLARAQATRDAYGHELDVRNEAYRIIESQLAKRDAVIGRVRDLSDGAAEAVNDPESIAELEGVFDAIIAALATTGGETAEKVNGLNVHDWQKIATAKDEANAAAVAAIDELADAIRLTVEYVGNDTLPPIEGWSWFDALMKYRPELAEEFERNPILLYAKHLGVPVDPTSPETTEGQS